MELGAGQGRQRGDKYTRETAADAGTRNGEQSRAAEADGWRVWTTSSWMALRDGRGGGEQV